MANYIVSAAGSGGDSGFGDLDYFDVQLDGTTYNSVLAGGIQITQTGTPVSTLPVALVTECTDLLGTLQLGSQYGFDAPVSFAGQTGIKPSWGANNNGAPPLPIDGASAAAAIQNAAQLFYGNFSVNMVGGTVADQRAGLQLAIWAELLQIPPPRLARSI